MGASHTGRLAGGAAGAGVFLVASGSGEREPEADGLPSAHRQSRLRFYWPLAFSKPKLVGTGPEGPASDSLPVVDEQHPGGQAGDKLGGGCGGRRSVDGTGDRERDSVGLVNWDKGSQSLLQAEWCARKTNCHFHARNTQGVEHRLRSSHRECLSCLRLLV